MKEENRVKLIAPRLAFNPNKKQHFYDKDGNELKNIGTKQEPGKEDLKWEKNITVKFYMRNPTCQIWYTIGGTQYCFKLDCKTGAYIGPCS